MSSCNGLCSKIFKFLAPPQAIPQLPDDQVEKNYSKHRWLSFTGIFVGYAASYLVRSPIFSLAMPKLIEEYHFTKSQLGVAASAFMVAYGFSKFLMGNVSDRSNPKYFLAIGLIIPALTFMALGTLGDVYSQNIIVVGGISLSILIMFGLMFIAGWGNGMCYPPCVRVLAHWYTVKERSLVMSAWNISHNLGGFLAPIIGAVAATFFGAIFGGWQSMFYVTAVLAIIGTFVVVATVNDTPQSLGLPSIEEYHTKNHLSERKTDAVVAKEGIRTETELSAKEIFFKHIFNNKAVWYLSFANIFVYLVRFGIHVWIPTYLSQVKHYDLKAQTIAMVLYELAGIPSMMLGGYLSYRFFQNRRTPVIVISMALMIFAILLYWLNPAGNHLIDNLAIICMGFLIYIPVVMVGMQAVDVVYKKAVGTATGMTGFFGYVAGSLCASAVMGYVVDLWSWGAGFIMLLVSCVLAIAFLLPIWNTGGEDM